MGRSIGAEYPGYRMFSWRFCTKLVLLWAPLCPSTVDLVSTISSCPRSSPNSNALTLCLGIELLKHVDGVLDRSTEMVDVCMGADCSKEHNLVASQDKECLVPIDI
jgi:hypothetical protein